MNKKDVKRLMRFMSLISLVVLLFLFVKSQQMTLATEYKIDENHPLVEVIKPPVQGKIERHDIHTISHQEIVSLTDQFIEQLVQDTNDDYQVIHFQTKEELLNQFEGISSRETALEFIDFYYTEEGNELFIVPTELPPWFVKDHDYEVMQMANNKVKVIQDNALDLYGDYMIEVEFTFCDNWTITNVHHLYREQGEQEEEGLPIL